MDNILIIWDGERKLDPFRLECIARAKEIYPNVKMSCITKDIDLLPKTIDKYLAWDEMLAKIWEKWCVRTKDITAMSDFFRYYYLSEHPHTLYIDTDVYIHKKIEEGNNIAKWGPDYSAIWNGNQCKFFEYVVGLRKSNDTLMSLLKLYPYDCGDLSKHMSHRTKDPADWDTLMKRKAERIKEKLAKKNKVTSNKGSIDGK